MSATGDDILNLMVKYLGTPYVWGGESPSGFDCSGLMQYVFGKAGVKIPRTAAAQAAGPGQHVNPKDMRPGDLLFFDFDKSRPGIDHVAIYIGNGHMIEAPKPGASVHVTNVYATPVQVSRYAAGGTGNNVATSKYAGGATYPSDGGGSFVPSSTGSQGAPDKLDMNQLANDFGWDAAFLKSIPELANLFSQALNDPAGQWTTQKFSAKLEQTNWWKHNSDAVRQNILQETRDPATFKSNVASKAADIQALASSMGANLNAAELAKVSARAYTTGMSDTQLRSVLSAYIHFNATGALGGDAGSIADGLRQMAYNNGVKLSDSYIITSARRVESGQSTAETEASNVREMAASAFPQWATQIKAGQNLSDIASPYVQTMASTLEMDPAKIDLFDPTIRGALSSKDDKGQPSSQSLWQFEQSIKQDPRWMQTNNARESLFGVAHGILQDWGVAS